MRMKCRTPTKDYVKQVFWAVTHGDNQLPLANTQSSN